MHRSKQRRFTVFENKPTFTHDLSLACCVRGTGFLSKNPYPPGNARAS